MQIRFYEKNAYGLTGDYTEGYIQKYKNVIQTERKPMVVHTTFAKIPEALKECNIQAATPIIVTLEPLKVFPKWYFIFNNKAPSL